MTNFGSGLDLHWQIAKLETDRERLICLLSQWYEAWNDCCDPTGDMLDETIALLESAEAQE